MQHHTDLNAIAKQLIALLPERLQPMARWRFIRFGLVGASGTVINVVVLYAAQEFLFRRIADFHDRLNYSIALAITCATISNFYWNRRLTWRDRKAAAEHSALYLFIKYVMAAALAIAVQSLLTKWLALYLHYIVANLVGIAVASLCSYVANDRMTFRRHKAEASATNAATPTAAGSRPKNP
ncbi:MAG: GtrA-like protein [Polaromonas sp.]|jgi:putative flippase GtrA|nr:GtrA-like protein [Polaromonas sp.]